MYLPDENGSWTTYSIAMMRGHIGGMDGRSGGCVVADVPTRIKELREAQRWYSETNWFLDAREQVPLNNYGETQIGRAFEALRELTALLESLQDGSAIEKAAKAIEGTWIFTADNEHMRLTPEQALEVGGRAVAAVFGETA